MEKRTAISSTSQPFAACWLLCTVLLCTLPGGGTQNTGPQQPTLADRLACSPDDVQPADRVNTSQRVLALRAVMTNRSIDAFIIPARDAHGSECTADRDKRLEFISGFPEPAGHAVVTRDKAAFWTDQRYVTEAEDVLGCDWILMKAGEDGVPSLTQWLSTELEKNSVVGADPFLVPNGQWVSYQAELSQTNIVLQAMDSNPVDEVWGANQPALPDSNITVLDLEHAGVAWDQKISALDSQLILKGLHAYVVTSLDEIAWLFNLRASDIEYNPVFLSYAIVEFLPTKIRLYMHDKGRRLALQTQGQGNTTTSLTSHLFTDTAGNCNKPAGEPFCVEVKDYDPAQVVEDIKQMALVSRSNIWVTPDCNYAIYSAIPEGKRVVDYSTIAVTKMKKNDAESSGMWNATARDSALVIEFLSMLEKDVTAGSGNWTELSAAQTLDRMRGLSELSRGLSLETMSAVGDHSAVYHYRPSPSSNRRLTPSGLYLLETGGQYLDGTTHVTRTTHFGKPSAREIDYYTRVLMGVLDLNSLIWPHGLYGRELDAMARSALWDRRYDYSYDTAHGVGAYLSVHEGPGVISLAHPPPPDDLPLDPHMFFSVEPGYYEPGVFGIRLGSIVMVEEADNEPTATGKTFLRFKPITLVPFEPKLINYTLLSDRQIGQLNSYHKLTRSTMEPLLTTDRAKAWLRRKTQAYSPPITFLSSACSPAITMATVVMTTATVLANLLFG